MAETTLLDWILGWARSSCSAISMVPVISQVAVNNGPWSGACWTKQLSLPLRIACLQGTFFSWTAARMTAAGRWNMSMDRFAGAPECWHLLRRFTRFMQQCSPTSSSQHHLRLPLETLSGEEARTTVKAFKSWMKTEHT